MSSPPHKLPSYKEDDPKIAGENSSCCTGAQTSFNKNKEFPDFIEFEVSEVGISLDYEQMPTLFFFFKKKQLFCEMSLTQTRRIKQTPPEKVLGH